MGTSAPLNRAGDAQKRPMTDFGITSLSPPTWDAVRTESSTGAALRGRDGLLLVANLTDLIGKLASGQSLPSPSSQ